MFSLYCFAIQITRKGLVILRRGSVAVDSLLIVAPIEGVLCLFHVLLYIAKCVLSSLAIILTGKRERVALLCLSSWCLVALPHGAVGWSAVCGCGIF